MYCELQYLKIVYPKINILLLCKSRAMSIKKDTVYNKALNSDFLSIFLYVHH